MSTYHPIPLPHTQLGSFSAPKTATLFRVSPLSLSFGIRCNTTLHIADIATYVHIIVHNAKELKEKLETTNRMYRKLNSESKIRKQTRVLDISDTVTNVYGNGTAGYVRQIFFGAQVISD